VQAAQYAPNRPIKAGYVGNLLMPYIDREAMLALIERRSDVEFHLWGPREPKESNVGAEGDAARFIRDLMLHRNVILHGPRTPSEISGQIADMDLLLLCYAVDRDPNHGCNSHKILEYMSTGRVIVANHVSDYSARPHLIEMVPADGSRTLADLFDSVVNDLERYNGSSYRERRLRYVLDNSYSKQIDRISSFRNELAQSSPIDGALGHRREA